MSNKINVQRYNPKLDWSDCYYEGDPPSATMEECICGAWVSLADYQAMHKANLYLVDINNQAIDDIKELQRRNSVLLTLIQSLTSKSNDVEVVLDQLCKYSEHQRNV